VGRCGLEAVKQSEIRRKMRMKIALDPKRGNILVGAIVRPLLRIYYQRYFVVMKSWRF
jgi:hypothetical protein